MAVSPVDEQPGHTRRVLAAARRLTALTERVGDELHLPVPGTWECNSCPDEQPWPCDTAREGMARAYQLDRVGLAIFMAGLLFQAIADLPKEPHDELYGRFVAWTR